MKSTLWTRTRERVRYYLRGLRPHEAVVSLLLDVVGKCGVRIAPFHLVEEGLSLGRPPPDAGLTDIYQMRFLTPEDMPALAAMREEPPSESDLRQRLEEGKRCLGITRGGTIVACTWFDLEACRLGSYFLFPLKSDEAYLFDAYTAEAARGSGIAPFARYRVYEEVARLGRVRCYSITMVFNAPSARFKAKLGARVLELGVLFELFGQWRTHWILRRYPIPSRLLE